MDQYTGEVKAIVGGRGEKISQLFSEPCEPILTGSQVPVSNRLGVYAPAIDTGKV